MKACTVEEIKHPSNKAEKRITTNELCLDNCEQAATLWSHPQSVSVALSSSRLGLSDDTNDLMVIFILSQSTLCCSWIRWSVPGKGLSSAVEKWVSRIVNKLAPISLMLDSNFAVEDFPSDIKLCKDKNRMASRMSCDWISSANRGPKSEIDKRKWLWPASLIKDQDKHLCNLLHIHKAFEGFLELVVLLVEVHLTRPLIDCSMTFVPRASSISN